MDDYSLSSLSESKNEWCARLVNTLTPSIIDGLKSIYKEAFELCIQNEEEDKYLMTFQTFLSRIPKWNETMLKDERKRIEDSTSCSYLEDLITCVHVIQLKALTCVRVGQKQKKIDIDIPSTDTFIHRIYIIIARKLYTNIYLFEKDIPPLELQKRNRELELIVKEGVLNAVRDTMPVEDILRAYMDETEEQNVEVNEKIIEEVKAPVDIPVQTTENTTESPTTVEIAKEVPKEVPKESTNIIVEKEDKPVIIKEDVSSVQIENPQTKLTFGDTDNAIDINGVESTIDAPKSIERLENIAKVTAEKRRAEAEEEEDEEKIKIGDSINLDITDINNLTTPSIKLEPPVLEGIEVLG